MIVHQPACLHHRIANRRADKLETAPQQILAQRSDSAERVGTSAIARRRLCSGFPRTKLQRYASKLPHSFCTARKAPALRMAAAIFNRLRTMPASPSNRATYIVRVKVCHGADIPLRERRAVIFTFFQNRRPAQPRLRAFQNQKLEQLRVIVLRHSPLLVVIREVRLGSGPWAARHCRKVAAKLPHLPSEICTPRAQPPRARRTMTWHENIVYQRSHLQRRPLRQHLHARHLLDVTLGNPLEEGARSAGRIPRHFSPPHTPPVTMARCSTPRNASRSRSRNATVRARVSLDRG